MPDKLRKFYESLKANKNVTGLPDDFDTFATAMADTANARKFYDKIKGSKYITGLPKTYEDFATAFAEDISIEAPEFKPILPVEPKIGRETTAIDIPIITMEQMQLKAETEEEEKKKSQEEGRETGYAAGEAALLQPLRSFGKFDLDQERGFLRGRDEFVTEQANLKYGYDKAIEEKKKISPKISNEDATVAVINDMARDINENVWNKERRMAFRAGNDLKRISNEIAANQKQLELTPGDNALILRQKQLDEELARKAKVFTDLMGDNYRQLFDEEKRTFLDTDWTEQDNQDVEKIYKEHKEWSVSALGEILYEENTKLRYLRDIRHKVIYG
ncbi:MAG TPA: hypothetical protein VMV77_21795, partial [Bacteroidales bacterium]|nr:hypothetical protein [Bacteroidales bacterium]